jgi:hypothetical protein
MLQFLDIFISNHLYLYENSTRLNLIPASFPSGGIFGQTIIAIAPGTFGSTTYSTAFQTQSVSTPEPTSLIGLVAVGAGLLASKRQKKG